MKTMIIWLFLLIFLVPFSVFSQDNLEKDFNCFSILVGKKATVDGSILLAHNEDDGGERIVNWYKVPNHQNQTTDSITLKRGHKIAQVATTNSYLWLEIPELEFSDSYINQYGLTIASDACQSREDQAELEGGGIGYWLRRLMIERAKTAREAVEIGGKLVETIGYASSGRTYCIADSKETWMLSVVKGKHWVAKRIPDNHVAIIPNYYTISTIDLTDTANYLGSTDLINYAQKRDWYNPKTDGEFNFRKAYSNQKNLSHIDNLSRHWVSINALSKETYALNDEFPFSFIPKKKLGLKDIFKVLRNHYEGTDLAILKNLHKQEVMSVCSNTNQYGFVAQLRDWMPSEIGDVFWIAPRRPCTQAFIPIYSGIISVPNQFSNRDYTTAIATHFDKIKSYKNYTKEHKYQVFYQLSDKYDAASNNLILNRNKKLFKFENKLLKKQNKIEKKLVEMYKKNPIKTKNKLTRYSNRLLLKITKGL